VCKPDISERALIVVSSQRKSPEWVCQHRYGIIRQANSGQRVALMARLKTLEAREGKKKEVETKPQVKETRLAFGGVHVLADSTWRLTGSA
jgi:hypothetical protein